jgi:hypothetical protein
MSNKKEFELRMSFLKVYDEFNLWLRQIGFVVKHSSTTQDFNYSHYDEYVDSMYGVEFYTHPVLKLSLRFVRDNNEHKVMFVGEGLFGEHSEVIPLEDVKPNILEAVRQTRDLRLKELEPLLHL